jgi:uracil-DNA glycosylase
MHIEELYAAVDTLHDKQFPHHELRPIHGAGRKHKPNVMFVFINPTARNASTSRSWKGPRYPFIGTKQIWRIFHRAGLFDDMLMQRIEAEKEWSLKLAQDVERFLEKKGFYITNIVKWAGHDATLPDKEKIRLFLPLLKEEIGIVQPKHIITFGAIPYEHLTGNKTRLIDHFTACRKAKRLLHTPYGNSRIIPCYFPVGRGDPKRAVELLQMVPLL